jgi:hypothetical protein
MRDRNRKTPANQSGLPVVYAKQFSGDTAGPRLISRSRGSNRTHHPAVFGEVVIELGRRLRHVHSVPEVDHIAVLRATVRSPQQWQFKSWGTVNVRGVCTPPYATGT